jgi:uncharacterized protein
MNLEELRAFKPQILEIAKQYGVSDIRVFGSVARGDADETSDVDLLIDAARHVKLFDIFAFKHKIEDMLKKEVDIVEIDAVKNPLRKRYMLEDAKPL